MAIPTITPAHLRDDFGLSAEIEAPLKPPWTDEASFAKTVTKIRDEVAIDAETARVALNLIQHWHTMLVGPPGTGKTMLAERLAELWNVRLIRITPSMDWTTFHAIGGMAPIGDGLGPYDGEVTKAALDCCLTAIEHQATGSGPQGVWLLVDEVNRCEADRVFTPLLTTLGSRKGPQRLDLAHRDEAGKRWIAFPPAFRIIATANLSDAQFVEQLSQAFLRRFQRVDLRVPGRPPEAEIASPDLDAQPSKIDDPFLQELTIVGRQVAELRPEATVLDDGLPLLAQLVMLARYALRWTGYGTTPEKVDPPYDTVALGTAQLVDALLLAADLADSPGGMSPADAVDVAAARTIAPQLAPVGLEGLRVIREQLDALGILPRVRDEIALAIQRFESGSYF